MYRSILEPHCALIKSIRFSASVLASRLGLISLKSEWDRENSWPHSGTCPCQPLFITELFFNFIYQVFLCVPDPINSITFIDFFVSKLFFLFISFIVDCSFSSYKYFSTGCLKKYLFEIKMSSEGGGITRLVPLDRDPGPWYWFWFPKDTIFWDAVYFFYFIDNSSSSSHTIYLFFLFTLCFILAFDSSFDYWSTSSQLQWTSPLVEKSDWPTFTFSATLLSELILCTNWDHRQGGRKCAKRRRGFIDSEGSHW